MYKDTLAPVGKAVSPFVYSSVFVVYEFIVNSSLYVVYLDECNCWQILSRFLSLALYLCTVSYTHLTLPTKRIV